MIPRVWYGSSYLLIRNTSESASDLVERRGAVNTSLIPPGARGVITMGNLSNTTVLRIPYQSQMSYLE
jgi:hypothetical protein